MDAGDKVLYLVCEGGCNPDLVDYDAATRRHAAEVNFHGSMAQAGALATHISDQARQLNHTCHVKTASVYDVRLGFCGSWKCQACGHTRRF